MGWNRWVVLVTVGTLVAAVPALAEGGADTSCPGFAVSARPDTVVEGGFSAYGDDNTLLDDWTGGDGTYSIRLPDGRDLWIFSDSFLGAVNEDGSRPTNSPFINNSAVVQDAGGLVQTLHGGSPDDPTSLFLPTDGSSWYWPQEGLVEQDLLRLFLQKYTRTGPGMWDWEWTGTDIADLSLPDLILENITPGPAAADVTFGGAVIQRGTYTYIYGVEDLQFVNYLHLARAPLGDLLGTWEYLGASGWSTDPADSVRLADDVGNGFSVTQVAGHYVLVTFADSNFFGNEIVLRVACRPWGPWGTPTHVYDAPESQGGLFSYNAHAHEQFTEKGRRLLVSYDVNTFNGETLWEDVTIYRPRFVRVELKPAS